MEFTCSHCGHKFTELNDGKIPTHDYPKSCRQVCPGAWKEPKECVAAEGGQEVD